MQPKQLQKLAMKALEDLKATDITPLDVRKKTTITDYMIICSGTSNRHIKSLANHVIMKAKLKGIVPIGVEGDNTNEWVLVDLGSVIIHIMLPAVRSFYNLEERWTESTSS